MFSLLLTACCWSSLSLFEAVDDSCEIEIVYREADVPCIHRSVVVEDRKELVSGLMADLSKWRLGSDLLLLDEDTWSV